MANAGNLQQQFIDFAFEEMEHVKVLVPQIKGMLGDTNSDNLKRLVLDRVCSDIDRCREDWAQCTEQMTDHNNFQTLQAQTQALSNDANVWFYIGHVETLLNPNFNLWNAKPTAAAAIQTIQGPPALSKTHTHYITLQNVPGEHKQALLGPFIGNHHRCLNATNTNISQDGVLYVQEYTP